MRLKSTNYISPIPTEGKFDEVFIEEKLFSIEKGRKYMSIEFEMYYFRDGVKVELDTRTIAFYGIAGDSVTSNKLAVISVPNENYQAEVDAVPMTVEVTNPETNEISVMPNPNHDAQVAAVPHNVTVPFLQYLYTHEGNLPEVYEIVDWGYPNFEDALKYFNGGDRTNPDITISNPFAKEWVKNNIIMKGEAIGVQFDFVAE